MNRLRKYRPDTAQAYDPRNKQDDPDAFSITYQDCCFIYGRTFSGRYLLLLSRILSPEEISQLGIEAKTNVMKIITARDMNSNQRNMYNKRRKTQ